MANHAIRETSYSSESKRPSVSADAPRPVCVVPQTGPDRKRRMSETIARVAEEDRELLIKLAR